MTAVSTYVKIVLWFGVIVTTLWIAFSFLGVSASICFNPIEQALDLPFSLWEGIAGAVGDFFGFDWLPDLPDWPFP